MNVFLDTNVLIAAVLELHEYHPRALPILQRVQDGADKGFIGSHSLAEMYAMLTKSPAPYHHSPEQALVSIEENILKHFNISDLSGADYAALIREAALSGIQGGTIYDLVLLKSAIKSKVDVIYTLNLKHFQAIAPTEIRSLLSLP